MSNDSGDWQCSCGEHFPSLTALQTHAELEGGLLHADPIVMPPAVSTTLLEGVRRSVLNELDASENQRGSTIPALERLRDAVLAAEDPRSMALLACSHAVGVAFAAGCTTEEVRRWFSAFFGEGR